MTTEVNARTGAVTKLAAEWPRLEALMGGTAAMRAAGKAFLPKETLEDEADWEVRKERATLFPAYRRTVMVMAGKPFSKAATLSEDVPPQIKEWAEDIDREGVSLHVFGSEMFREAFFGLCGILVDAPKVAEIDGAVVTKAAQRAAGVRPYFVRVMHDQLLGWRIDASDGSRRLVQLRIKESAVVPDGEYGEKSVERVRVLEPGLFRVFEKSKDAAGKESWSEVENGTTGLAYIPFVPVYGFRQGFMNGTPPLLDLAYLNVKHWQEQSDQDDSTRFARKRMVVVTGVDADQQIVASSNYAVKLPQGADVKVVQGSAESVTVGRESLTALEDQMIQAGAELLVKKPGDRSATEAANDAEGNKSDLQRMAEGFEDSLDAALQMMADYASLDSGGHVELFKDFGVTNLSDASGQLVLSMEQAGLISTKTAIAELKRRGELSAEVDADEEAEAIADQPPPLGMTPPANDPGADPVAA